MIPSLRSHQIRAELAVSHEYQRGARAVLVVSPTGTGKTTMGSSAACKHIARGERTRVAWFAHRGELIEQAAERLQSFGLEVGYNGLGTSARTQVTTVQTCLARNQVPEATLAIFDEAHHYADAAEDWSRVRQAYVSRHILGYTATPERGDGTGLRGAFDALVVAAQISEMQAIWREDQTQGLVPLRIIHPGRTLRKADLAVMPFDAYHLHAPGQSAVVFARHLDDAAAFVAGFNKLGYPAAMVAGRTPKDERRSILTRWRRGDLRVVVNVNVLTEGFDYEALQCVILGRSFGSFGQLVQATGRAMRPSPGKSEALLIDLRGITVDPSMGRPDADVDYSLDGIAMRAKGGTQETLFCSRCGMPPDMCMCEQRAPEMARSLNLELQPWQEKMRREKVDKRAARLAVWLKEARAKGHKDMSVRFKYRGVFGFMPTREIWAMAESLVDGGSDG